MSMVFMQTHRLLSVLLLINLFLLPTLKIYATDDISVQSNAVPEIIIGAVLPLHGEGEVVRDGLQAAVNRINNAGGLGGRRVQLRVRDDAEDTKLAVDEIEQLLPETSILLNVMTHGVIEHTKALREKNQILFFGPDENSSATHQQENSGIINTKASLEQELRALIDYAIDTLKKRSLAIFYEESAWGHEGLALAEKIIAPYHAKNSLIHLVAKAAHPMATVEIASAVKKIARVNPDAIICIAGRHATYHFVPSSLNAGLIHTSFLGTSNLLPLQSHLKKTRGIDFIATATVPNPGDSTIPLIEQFHTDLREANNGTLPSALSLWGYLNMMFLATVAKSITGAITASAIIAASQMCKNQNVNGVVLDFDQNSRTLYQQLWISPAVNMPWIEIAKKNE